MLHFETISADEVRPGDILMYANGGHLVETITRNGSILSLRGGNSHSVVNYYDRVRILRIDADTLATLAEPEALPRVTA